MSKKSYVTKQLENTAKIYDERNALYGDNYKRHGSIVSVMFPDGIVLETPEDFNRFALLNNCIAKLTRYANQWENGHNDSLDDLSVYAQMLREIDNEE